MGQTKFKDKWNLFWKDPIYRWLFISMVGLFSFAVVTEFFHTPQTPTKNSYDTVDTVIPAGYVLVPIELQNAETMSSLIGEFAIVDLYTVSLESRTGKGQRVGQRLRLLRAPLNPQLFAVLVPENETKQVLETPGPFVAVIQNRAQAGMGAVEKKVTKQSRIEYFQGG